MNKAKIHTPYHLKDGTRVPSVTTALGELSKPALIPWAWGLGIKGLDYRTFRDELADVGSLAHRMILCHIKDETLSTDDFTPNQVSLAENCFLKYLEWERQHKVEPIAVEEPMVSELWKYGGTPDFYGTIDGLLTVMDFKTGKAIYEDYWYQIGAYGWLVKEKYGMDFLNYRILNIGRDETEKFVEEQRTGLTREFEIFISALHIYQLKKAPKKEDPVVARTS